MKTTKILTKKGYTAVTIDDEFSSIVLVNGEYHIYLNSPTYGKPCEDQSGQEPFIKAYEDFKAKKEAEKLEKIEEQRKAEEKRVNDIKERALGCESPVELVNEFGYTSVETASHWSDLYEGRSGYAIKLDSRQEFEDFEIIRETLNIEGDYVELRNRAGEHHCTADRVFDLNSYQKALRNHFSDKYFYKSQETDHDFYFEKIKEAEDIEEVEEILKNYNDITAGYYDCNGNLEIEEEEVESDDLTGYVYDVYSYSFGFAFEYKNSFNNEDSEDEED